MRCSASLRPQLTSDYRLLPHRDADGGAVDDGDGRRIDFRLIAAIGKVHWGLVDVR